ncbi:hypothetical protein HAX54_001066 [Datura stramonium]|uniref:Uncharacterized protein n=1 Tax=Datura stramonium TaxID=4076 RepID=A0ABS8WQI8_DATST|nr:hypothetical protein [Datura stramonium]
MRNGLQREVLRWTIAMGRLPQEKDLTCIKQDFGWGDQVTISVVPGGTHIMHHINDSSLICAFLFTIGFRLPIPKIVENFYPRYQVCLAQLTPQLVQGKEPWKAIVKASSFSQLSHLILLVLIRNLRDSYRFIQQEGIHSIYTKVKSSLPISGVSRSGRVAQTQKGTTPEVVVVKDDDEEDGWSKAAVGEATFFVSGTTFGTSSNDDHQQGKIGDLTDPKGPSNFRKFRW